MLGRIGRIAGILGFMLFSVPPAFSQSRKLGTVTFPTSGAPAARSWLLQGVGLLHSFEYEDAGEAGQTAGGEAKSTASAQDEEGIRMVLADFIEAWNKHDAKAFSMVFAEDADFTNVRGVSAHGRAGVEKLHAPLFATRFKDTNQKMTKAKIRFIRSDVAAVDAWWEMTGAKGPEGQDIPVRKGLLNFVMTKEGEKWLITVMHNMELPASP